MQRSENVEYQLIPPPEIAPPSVKHLPFAKRVALWAELVDECEALLLAGLRNRIGPEGDLHAAYREWYARYMKNHEAGQIQFLQNLSRRERPNGN
jgi:hypothetical protein